MGCNVFTCPNYTITADSPCRRCCPPSVASDRTAPPDPDTQELERANDVLGSMNGTAGESCKIISVTDLATLTRKAEAWDDWNFISTYCHENGLTFFSEQIGARIQLVAGRVGYVVGGEIKAKVDGYPDELSIESALKQLREKLGSVADVKAGGE